MVSATSPMDPALGSSEFVNTMWVQCENESCLKWRLLSPAAAARVDLGEPWFCSMNADSSYNSCAASEQDFPEESQLLESGYKIVYSQLPLGSLVLVKLQNWPSWPGILCPDPFKGNYVTYDRDGNVDKYYIEFLGHPRSTAWISAAFVGHFSLTLKTAECKNKKRWYRSALEEAYRLYRCSPEQRLAVCCRPTRDRTRRGTEAPVVTKERIQGSKNNTEKKRPRVRKRKRDAALKYSVDIFCSDEALSKENMGPFSPVGFPRSALSCLRDRRFAERTGENAAASTGAHGKRGRARARAVVSVQPGSSDRQSI
ncbi:zinc finger CW-type PWWP domain protein 2 isoform X3 [Rattus norvegicus]|uniref:Zinc finger CW-type and PWWP domain containing 2 n=1 Tax=Rattus norvegicus TaxID=10116 RepID=A0A8I6GHL5_RAT|nr:zinc finger CW-type PWWP domain protein 2 isoform X3 [Rattus norvegicus]